MTCDEFGRRLDRQLAGDGPASSGRGTSVMAAHMAGCAACRRLWRRTRALSSRSESEAEHRGAIDAAARARARLREAFVRIGRPPVSFASLNTPVGVVFVGATSRGVCDVTFDEPNEDRYRARLAKRAPEVIRDRDAVAVALEEIDAYFTGELTRFTVPIDVACVTAFTARVLGATRRIPFGRLLSYGEIASRIGSPGASRAVGGALGRNPVPIIVPCHRVIARGGRIGGFTGGLPTKRALLRIEGHGVTGAAVRERP